MFLGIRLLCITIFALLTVYAIGNIVVRILKIPLRERFFNLFIYLLTGLSIIICSYALIRTNLSSILFLVIILFTILLLSLRYSVDSTDAMVLEKSNKVCKVSQNILLIAITATLVFLVQYGVLYDSTSTYLQTPFQDSVYYSRLTLPLNQLGLETNSLEAVYPQFLTEEPYHYFELWLNALLVEITGLPSVWVYFVSSSAILITITAIGFMAVFAHFQLRHEWITPLALLLLFVTGTRWSFLQHYSFVENGELLSSFLLCINPKLVPIYLFTLLGALLLLIRHYISAGIALAIIPLIFISTTPVVAGGIVAIACYLIIKRELSWSEGVLMMLPMVAATVYIILFYTMQPEPYQFANAGRIHLFRTIIPELNEVKTLINITVGVILNYSISFIAYILIVAGLVLHRKTRLFSGILTIIWVWFGTNILVASVVRAFGNHFLDSFQFFSNPIVPLTPVVLSIVLGAILSGASKKMYILIIFSFMALLFINIFETKTFNTQYSKKFLENVEKISSNLGARGGYIMADEDYKNTYMLSSNSYTVGNYISNFRNNYAFVSLSALDVDDFITDSRFKRDSTQAEQAKRNSTIYRFTKFQSLLDKNLSLDSLKYKFVTQKEISFICVSKNAQLPPILWPLVSSNYTDELSGEKLYILNNKNNSRLLNAYGD